MSAQIAERARERGQWSVPPKVLTPSCPYCQRRMALLGPRSPLFVDLGCFGCELTMAVPLPVYMAWTEAGF